MRKAVILEKVVLVTALAVICLARPSYAQGTPGGNSAADFVADTGAVAGPEGHGFEVAPAWETPGSFWFSTAPVYEPAWGYASVYPAYWGFPLLYSPPYPGPLNPIDYAVVPTAAAYTNLPVLGFNTPLHTAGGGPVPYVRTRTVINLMPGE